MPVAAPLIGAAVSIGGSAIAAGASSSAADKAAAAQKAANDQAIAEQRRQYDQNRIDLAPYRDAGSQALNQYLNLSGTNGARPQLDAITALQGSPAYQSLFQNGQNTILANAAATGGLRGGNTQSSLANFGRDTLAQVIQSQLADYSGLITGGQNAAAQTGTFGANSANAIADLLSGSGKAQSNAALQSGAATATAIGDITKTLSGAVNNGAIQNWVGKLF